MTANRPTLRTAAELADAGLIAPGSQGEAARVAARYAIAVTPAMVDLIDRSDPADPIARQFVPDIRELTTQPEELPDPIGDRLMSPVPGIVHRYADRVLLKIVGVCPVYCRFCFRREMVGPETGETLSPSELEAALAYIRAHSEIWEVVVTGGDPLMLSPRRIAQLGSALTAIPHVRVVRWHTRVPVVAPQRVTDALAAALRSSEKSVWIGLHANHARELTKAARAACRTLIGSGIPIVSQTVLLRGVNDDVATLEALMRAFVETGIKPYYLHHPDLAPGTAHFRTTIAEGQALMRELRRRLSGLAQPTYVIDIPGAHGKVPAGPAHVTAAAHGARIEDAAGNFHDYLDSCPGGGDP